LVVLFGILSTDHWCWSGEEKEAMVKALFSFYYLNRRLGAGTLALPGGHLEMGETWEECSTRELLEETNLLIKNVKFVSATNDIAIGGNLSKHYVTIFMQADVHEDAALLQNLEPDKCEGWDWVSLEELQHLSQETPSPLFDPLLHFFQSTGRHSTLFSE
jgi:8-oxo-dGTP diphosphatase